MDERPREESSKERTGLDDLLSRLWRPGPLVCIFIAAFLVLAGLGYFLIIEDTPPPKVVSQPPSSPSQPLVYDVEISSEMGDLVKQVDFAIIETMKRMDMGLNDLGLLDVEIRRLNGKSYHYQVLQLPAVSDQNLFLQNLTSSLTKRLPDAKVGPLATNELGISIKETPTHRLILKTIPLVLPRPEPQGPKLVIVIDDIGEDLRVLKGLLKLDFFVTLAVWPNATHTRRSVEMIAQKQRDLIIHFPMEPRGYPRYNPGDDALFVSMTPEQIVKRVQESVARIPEAIGVNNHMGSRFTADTAGMQVALTEFKRHGLFFLDSLTTGKSVAKKVARSADIDLYIRDVFIDNVKDVNAIILQLKKAENVSLKQGFSIAIGHPYKETLSALQQWGTRRNPSIKVIPLSELPPQ